MRLSIVLLKQVSQFRLTNYIPTRRIPGNVLLGKHRVRRTLSESEKLDMKRRIEIELENMAHLSRPYLTEEEDNLYENDPIRKEREEKALALKRRQEEIPEHIYLKRDLLDRVSCWDTLYEGELNNFNEFGDEGEIWFGKYILTKLVDAVCRLVIDKETTTILDIGTGNGHVIQRLLSRGYVHLTGIDYSEKSIELARTQIGSNIQFQVIDMTASDTSLLDHFDIGIDKGTLDAILLCSSDQRKAKREAYVATVHRHIKNLLFLISCNWTRNELLEFFQPKFSLECEIETPTMSFGGRQGKTVTFLVFKRND
ncbi:unnamed protein product [Rotaria magnacalcarata]|uniref:Protein-lysine N-methyltransferase UXM345_LOCUS19612 n=1 Tax=Rotaria magnacalcarata TaxID=392030 RepID=A0A819S4G1_9BILA|nr:unnamed protein product [Rotaria magnacalcarata]